MKLWINFHRRTGLTPGVYVTLDKFGVYRVLMLRMWWSALTFTWGPKQ